jgi:hypothetical protein
MPPVGLRAGVVIPAYEEGVSKRDRARQAIAGKTERELGEIARLLGIQFSDYALEEAGLAVLEHGTAAIITVITRRDAAECFGDDLCGEQDIVEVVRKLFPIDTMGTEFFSTRSLAHETTYSAGLPPLRSRGGETAPSWGRILTATDGLSPCASE